MYVLILLDDEEIRQWVKLHVYQQKPANLKLAGNCIFHHGFFINL